MAIDTIKSKLKLLGYQIIDSNDFCMIVIDKTMTQKCLGLDSKDNITEIYPIHNFLMLEHFMILDTNGLGPWIYDNKMHKLFENYIKLSRTTLPLRLDTYLKEQKNEIKCYVMSRATYSKEIITIQIGDRYCSKYCGIANSDGRQLVIDGDLTEISLDSRRLDTGEYIIESTCDGINYKDIARITKDLEVVNISGGRSARLYGYDTNDNITLLKKY